MGTNLKQFLKSLGKIEDKIFDEVDNIIKDVVSEVFRSLIESPPLGTPIDTGLAKANWIVSVNMPRPFQVGSKTNVGAAQAEQKRSFTSFKNQPLEGVNKIFINNGVSYISLLNDGSSEQSPRNFVQIAVQRGSSRLKRKRVIK